MVQKISSENAVSLPPKGNYHCSILHTFLPVKLKLTLKINSNKTHTIQNKSKKRLNFKHRADELLTIQHINRRSYCWLSDSSGHKGRKALLELTRSKGKKAERL